LEILRDMTALPEQSRLQIGIGISTGQACVSNVGGTDYTDYTVLGDTIKIATYLQGAAAPGEVLIAQETYEPIATDFPDVQRREPNLKGKIDRVTAWQIGRL
jgi:class 3 adenylate cyclase